MKLASFLQLLHEISRPFRSGAVAAAEAAVEAAEADTSVTGSPDVTTSGRGAGRT